MKKNIIAKTFTPLYDVVEDRIKVVINYEDIQNRVDFMITRNFILNLIPSAEEFVTKYYGVVDFEQNTQNKTKIKTGVSREFQDESISKTDNSNLEFLKTDDELLIEANFLFDPNTKQTVLILNSKNIIAKANLNAFMFTQVFKIIKSAIPRIKWGISHNF